MTWSSVSQSFLCPSQTGTRLMDEWYTALANSIPKKNHFLSTIVRIILQFSNIQLFLTFWGILFLCWSCINASCNPVLESRIWQILTGQHEEKAEVRAKYKADVGNSDWCLNVTDKQMKGRRNNVSCCLK